MKKFFFTFLFCRLPFSFLLCCLCLLVFSAFSTACTRNGGTDFDKNVDITKSSDWLYQGWGCAPSMPSNYEKPKKGNCPSKTKTAKKEPEYIYIPFFNQNSPAGRRSNNLTVKKNTCYRSARNLIASNRLNRLLADFINETYDLEYGTYFANKFLTDPTGPIGDIRLYECCSPINDLDLELLQENFAENGFAKKKERDALLDAFRCSSRSKEQREDDLTPTSWNSCICMVSIHFQGGDPNLKLEMNQRWKR